MLKALVTFAAISMAGTVILSTLPEGGIKRTAGMAIGLLTLMCWAEEISHLLGFELNANLPASLLSPTSTSLTSIQEEISASLSPPEEVMP